MRDTHEPLKAIATATIAIQELMASADAATKKKKRKEHKSSNGETIVAQRVPLNELTCCHSHAFSLWRMLDARRILNYKINNLCNARSDCLLAVFIDKTIFNIESVILLWVLRRSNVYFIKEAQNACRVQADVNTQVNLGKLAAARVYTNFLVLSNSLVFASGYVTARVISSQVRSALYLDHKWMASEGFRRDPRNETPW